MLRLKKTVKFRIKISKSKLIKLAALILVVGAAIILDTYFEKHPVEFKKLEAEKDATDNSDTMICFYNPFNSISAKILLQKIPFRILYEQSHNRLVQKFHQMHDSQILKSGYKKIVNSSILSFLQLIASHNYYSFSKEDPPVFS